MPKLYVVKLNTDERNKLLDIVNKGSNRARVITRTRILLWSDEGRLDEDIAASLQTTPARVGRIRKRYVLEGLEKAINDRPRSGTPQVLDVKGEATLVALACSDPPTGRAVWTMKLLANKLVELQVVETISDETVRLHLKKTSSNHGKNGSGRSQR